jgi:hypothetical protein
MRNKRLIEKITKVLGEEQLPIKEIYSRLSGELAYYPEPNRLSKIMRGKFEMVSIGSPKKKRNEWRNKNVMDRKIQAE